MSSLSVLTLNIANPSVERAQRQLEWLASRDEDVFVLTETKASDGCRLLVDAFQTVGYAVIFPEPGPGEYGTMIASKIRAEPDDWNQQLGYLPARAATTVLPAPGDSRLSLRTSRNVSFRDSSVRCLTRTSVRYWWRGRRENQARPGTS